MLIRKNTKEYKAISNIFHFHAIKSKSVKEKNIQLYIVENGKSLGDKIPIETLADNKDVYYEMNYGIILESFNQTNYQLHQADDNERLYFFRNTSNKEWDQTPFELSKSLHLRRLEFIDIVIKTQKEEAPPVKMLKAPVIAKSQPPRKEKGSAQPIINEQKVTSLTPPKVTENMASEDKIEENKSSDEPPKAPGKSKPLVKERIENKSSKPLKNKNNVEAPSSKETEKEIKQEQQDTGDYKSKEWLKVTSEGIEAFKYISDREILFIVFRPDSSCYIYYNVRKEKYLEIISQEHMATFVNQEFKGTHKYDFIGKVLL